MRQELIRFYSRAALALLMMLLTTVTAWANDAVTYIDMNGKTQTVTEYTEVTSGMSLSWASGTYVVKSDVTLSGCIKPKEADIDLILCDGKTLTVNGSSDGAFWVKTLNIYAQSNGTGVVNAKMKTRCYNLNIAGGTVTLDADGDNYGLYIFQRGSNYGLTVNGGNVTILNSKGNQGTIGFEGAGFVTQNGGTLTVTNSAGSYNYAIYGNPGTINFNGGRAEINGIIRNCQTINLNGGNVTVNGKINKESGYTVTYGFTHATDSYYIQSFVGVYSDYTRTVQVSDGQRLTDGTNIYTGTLSDSQISAISGKTLRQANFTDNGDDTYTIHNAAGWGAFCDLLEGGTSFTGKTIYLNGNIEVSRMAGDSGHKFTGTFNGQGNTLTVSYSGSSYVAPFRYVDGATIQNLVVEGTISSTSTRAAGVIGETGSPGEGGTTTSHIINCVSSSIITGGNYSGGFSIGGNVEIEGCVFNGTINISGDYGGGGFVGYSQNTLTITNCLFAPQSGSSAKGTFYYNGTAGTITNSYYTTALGTAQGKKACPAIAAPVGDATHATYSVSQITPYANGLTCGETFYYGGGENVSVSYVNESGYTVSHNCTALDPSHMPTPTTDLSGWYYVADDITYTDKITLGADVTFILADDKTMNIGTSESPRDGYCITGSTKDLTIYGQTNQSGTLNAYNDNSHAAAVKVNDYTQYGGNVNIDAKKGDALYPSFGNLTLTRGTLTANAASDAIKLLSDYSATVSGGTLTATGNIQGTFTIAAGQVFTDGNGHYYTGTLSADEKTAIDGQTLTRLTALQLADAGDNSAAIDKCNGIAFPVTLQGRTLYKDGDWNTLCLPFNVVDGDNTDELTFTGTPLEGATVKELLTSSNLDSNGQLTLNFNTVTSIEAGKPYIVKWEGTSGSVSDPVFSGVTVTSTTPIAVTSNDGKVKFVGQYSPFAINEGNIDEIIMLSTGNTLGYSQNPRWLRSFRAHFEIPTNGGAPAMNSFVLNFDDESTGISLTPDPSPRGEGSEYYTLDGRKLSGKPTTKGLYIHNGKKVVLH